MALQFQDSLKANCKLLSLVNYSPPGKNFYSFHTSVPKALRSTFRFASAQRRRSVGSEHCSLWNDQQIFSNGSDEIDLNGYQQTAMAELSIGVCSCIWNNGTECWKRSAPHFNVRAGMLRPLGSFLRMENPVGNTHSFCLSNGIWYSPCESP